jgi:hypothetical protein
MLVFLTSALVGGESKLHARAVLPLRKEPPFTDWIVVWVCTKAGLDAVEKRGGEENPAPTDIRTPASRSSSP